MTEFAEAMLQRSPGFASQVRTFEREHGPAGDDTLAVLAQASTFCWYEVEYERDYLDVCRAIGAGKSTSLFLCRQVTPERWAEMNSYVVEIGLGYIAMIIINIIVDRIRIKRAKNLSG